MIRHLTVPTSCSTSGPRSCDTRNGSSHQSTRTPERQPSQSEGVGQGSLLLDVHESHASCWSPEHLDGAELSPRGSRMVISSASVKAPSQRGVIKPMPRPAVAETERRARWAHRRGRPVDREGLHADAESVASVEAEVVAELAIEVLFPVELNGGHLNVAAAPRQGSRSNGGARVGGLAGGRARRWRRWCGIAPPHRRPGPTPAQPAGGRVGAEDP